MSREMQLTEKYVLDNGTLLIQDNTDKTWDRVFVFRQFRIFFTLQNSQYSPADLTDSYGKGIPDYIIRITHRLAIAYTLFIEGIGLRDFLKHGIFYEQGACCICVYLRDIPVEHGIASAQVAPCHLPGQDGFSAKGVKLIIHRNLHRNTLTPAHELFHLFQFSYASFNNVWFMEGLARWSQRLFQNTIPKMEPLPSEPQQLNSLLKKWHDAEYFWNRLTSLCSTGIMTIPAELQDCGIPINSRWIDGKYMALFLQQLELNLPVMRVEQSSRSLPIDNQWERIEKRSANNNRYIFKAMVEAIKIVDPKIHPELNGFLSLINPIVTNQVEYGFHDKAVQGLMRFLKKFNIGKITSRNGLLYSDYYDCYSRTLSFPFIDIDGQSITNSEMECFRCVSNIIGTLKISNNLNLSDFFGLINLESIEGDFIIDNTGVESIDGMNLLERVKGSIRIVNNKKLKSIFGFTSLDVVDQEIDIADNQNLRIINGFNSLRLIKKGGLSILRSPSLTTISGFNNLVQAKNIWLNNLQIAHVDFLEKLFEHQSNFPGFIKIELCQLTQIKAMKSLKSIASSFYLHVNRLTCLEGLENLKSVGASCSFSSNELADISQLRSLEKINGMLGLANNNLTSLKGLEKLSWLKTVKWGDQVRTLFLTNNPNLQDISALSNVLTGDRYLTVHIDDPAQYLKTPDPQSDFHKNILEIHSHKRNKLVPTYEFVRKDIHDYALFRETTHNKIRQHLVDFETDADILVLSFSGLNGNLGGMFYNRFPILNENVKTHKFFVNDTRNSWYHRGIQGFTKNIQETIDQIHYIATRKKYKKIICVGTSMGGYMSLLTGYIINATHIVAFAPQIFLDVKNRKFYNDTRWEKTIKKFPENIPEEFLDLSLLYRTKKNTSTNIQIHYGCRLLLDKAHVNHLGKYKNIQLYEYDIDDHYITRYLDKQGKLTLLIENILQQED